MNKQEFKELWENGLLKVVQEEIDDSWRHGNYMHTVYHHAESDTYWACNYQVSGDGEYHGIRDDDYEIFQVEPQTKTVVITEYVTVKSS